VTEWLATVLAAAGQIRPWQVVLLSVAGAVAGDSLAYLIGRRWGARLIAAGGPRFPALFGGSRVAAARALVARYGARTVVATGFVIAFRLLGALLAGALGMRYRRFLAATALGALLWSCAVALAVAATGGMAAEAVHRFSWAAAAVTGLAAVAVATAVVYRGRGGTGPRELAASVTRVASGLWRGVRRLPFTAALLAVYLVVGVASEALWSPAEGRPWYDTVAYGLPALREGRWWTVVSGTLLSEVPLHYSLVFAGILLFCGWCEYRLGGRRTALLFAGGQLVAVLGASLLLALLAPTGWPWAVELAAARDVGPSGGMFACLAAVTATTRSPWRLRWRIALGGGAAIALLYIGTLADLEHFLAVVPVLLLAPPVLGSHRGGRPSVREWRLLVTSALVAIAAVQVLVTLVPTEDPLGSRTTPGVTAWIDVLVDVVVILVVVGLLRAGRRLGWIVATVLAAVNTAEFVVLAVGAVVLDDFPAQGLVLLGNNALWAILLAMLLLGRRAFRASIRSSRRRLGGEPAQSPAALLRRYGGGTLSWMTLWPRTAHFSSSSGDSYIGYELHAGAAVALGDPVGPAAERATVLAEFVDACQLDGVVPVLFSVGDATVADAPRGWQRLTVAEDTLVDLPSLQLTGKRWGTIRTAINRAAREGIAFRLTRLSDEPESVVAQVRAISEEWVGDKALPEMGFTLGGVDEALDPEVRAGIAVDSAGLVHGVTSWLPVFGGDGAITGWTLDLMRRRDDGFGPVMEFLIASSALAFRDEGALTASLSGAPLSREGGEPEGVDAVLDALSRALEPLYGFQSLHAFKQKFNPRYETMSLAFRDEADLPRIALALTRAYLPNSSLLQIARMGVRGGR
jgi:phosphatidylglycerol lysyltransferase